MGRMASLLMFDCHIANGVYSRGQVIAYRSEPVISLQVSKESKTQRGRRTRCGLWRWFVGGWRKRAGVVGPMTMTCDGRACRQRFSHRLGGFVPASCRNLNNTLLQSSYLYLLCVGLWTRAYQSQWIGKSIRLWWYVHSAPRRGTVAGNDNSTQPSRSRREDAQGLTHAIAGHT